MGDFGYSSVKYLKTEEISIVCNEFIDLTVSESTIAIFIQINWVIFVCGHLAFYQACNFYK